MTPLCRCRLDPRAECPLHPTRDVRGDLLVGALVCFLLALAVALLWRAECFTNGVLR